MPDTLEERPMDRACGSRIQTIIQTSRLQNISGATPGGASSETVEMRKEMRTRLQGFPGTRQPSAWQTTMEVLFGYSDRKLERAFQTYYSESRALPALHFSRFLSLLGVCLLPKSFFAADAETAIAEFSVALMFMAFGILWLMVKLGRPDLLERCSLATGRLPIPDIISTFGDKMLITAIFLIFESFFMPMRLRVMLVPHSLQAFVGLWLMDRILGSSSVFVVTQMIACSSTVYFCQEYRARKRFALDSAGQRWTEEEKGSGDTREKAVVGEPRAGGILDLLQGGKHSTSQATVPPQRHCVVRLSRQNHFNSGDRAAVVGEKLFNEERMGASAFARRTPQPSPERIQEIDKAIAAMKDLYGSLSMRHGLSPGTAPGLVHVSVPLGDPSLLPNGYQSRHPLSTTNHVTTTNSSAYRSMDPRLQLGRITVRKGSLVLEFDVINTEAYQDYSDDSLVGPLAEAGLARGPLPLGMLNIPGPEDGAECFVQVGAVVHTYSWDSDTSAGVGGQTPSAVPGASPQHSPNAPRLVMMHPASTELPPSNPVPQNVLSREECENELSPSGPVLQTVSLAGLQGMPPITENCSMRARCKGQALPISIAGPEGPFDMVQVLGNAEQGKSNAGQLDQVTLDIGQVFNAEQGKSNAGQLDQVTLEIGQVFNAEQGKSNAGQLDQVTLDIGQVFNAASPHLFWIEVWKSYKLMFTIPVLSFPPELSAMAQELGCVPEGSASLPTSNEISDLGLWLELVHDQPACAAITPQALGQGPCSAFSLQLLERAVQAGRVHVAAALLDDLLGPCNLSVGAILSSPYLGCPLLHSAVLSSNLDMVEMVRQVTDKHDHSIPWDLPDALGFTAMHLATQADDLNFLYDLLSRYPDADAALHSAAGGHITPLEMLAARNHGLGAEAVDALDRGEPTEVFDGADAAVHSAGGGQVAVMELVSGKHDERRMEDEEALKEEETAVHCAGGGQVAVMELVAGKHNWRLMEDEEALKEETADMVINENSGKGSKHVSVNSLGTGSSTDSCSGVACAVLNTVKSIAPTKEASAGRLAMPNPLYRSIQSFTTPDAGAVTEIKHVPVKTRRLNIPPCIGPTRPARRAAARGARDGPGGGDIDAHEGARRDDTPTRPTRQTRTNTPDTPDPARAHDTKNDTHTARHGTTTKTHNTPTADPKTRTTRKDTQTQTSVTYTQTRHAEARHETHARARRARHARPHDAHDTNDTHDARRARHERPARRARHERTH
eukprot:gene1256-32604_t